MVSIHFRWTTSQKMPILSLLNGDVTVTVVPLKAFMQLVMPTIPDLMISQWTSLARPAVGHRNTPQQEIGHSSAELFYGRPLRDHLPHPVDMANIRREWLAVASDRELALAKRNFRNATAFNESNRTKDLPSLGSGDIVAVQNQSGPSPGRWDRTGIVREVRPNRQYIIQMLGYQRLVLRNRVHLW